ncbi:hypothetical protein [Sinomonas sp. P10A9]|uniref:PknH-like protein n=1 Tax=Sinomonas puerhi TaxID=3238584 RepID=A0AB39L0T2_9MICC
MTTDSGAATRRPPWVWLLMAACVLVGVGVIVAVAGLFMAPSSRPPATQPTPSAGASPAASSAPAVPVTAYGLSDALPLMVPPVWHAEPGADYMLTAAADSLTYASASDSCLLTFGVGPLRPVPSASAGRTTPAPSSVPTAPALSGPDSETAATRAALAGAVESRRSSAARVSVTAQDLTVVTTLDSLSGPLVDMAGADLRVAHADGTVTYVRLAVRAVPSATSAVSISAECPSAEAAATAMNHASVRAYLTGN